MNAKIIGVLAVAGATLGACATLHEYGTKRTALTLDECNRLLPDIINRPFLTGFAGLPYKATCVMVGDKYPVVHFAFDLSSAPPALRQQLGQAPGLGIARFYVVQEGLNPPNPPQYVVAATSDGISVGTASSDGGDITIAAPNGSNISILIRIAIVDPGNTGVDSKIYAWNVAKPQKSLGAAQVDLTDPDCPTADYCPGAEPSNWPGTYAARSVQTICDSPNVNCHNYLQFTIPYLSGETYKYWMRAFGVGTVVYNVDPKIINQPR